MSLALSKQIKNKSNLIKVVLENVLFDVNHYKQRSLSEIDSRDLYRAIEGCDQLIDIAKTIEENANVIRNSTE